MEGGRAADPERLRALLDAAQGRRRRAATAVMLRRVGAIAAARSDRFGLHAGDPVEVEAMAWLNAAVSAFGPYRDEEAFREPSELEAALCRLVARNALTGWCLVVAGAACPDDAPTVGTEAAALPALVAELRRALPAEYADTWIACRAQGWSVKVFHEGLVQLWRQSA